MVGIYFLEDRPNTSTAADFLLSPSCSIITSSSFLTASTTRTRTTTTKMTTTTTTSTRTRSVNMDQTNVVVTPEDVLVYVPNIIGYSRVVFTLLSLFLMMGFPQLWLVATFLYIASFVGDLFDGMFARKLNQTSSFGGLLDMVTDRCSTLGLLYVLGNDYEKYDDQIGFPIYQIIFLGLILLDISSHWCQMYSTCALGKHHKSEDGNEGRHFLVRWFYKYYFFFGYLCVGAEFTYIVAYVVQYSQGYWFHSMLQFLLVAFLPGCIMKQAVNVMQLASACYAVAEHDANQKNKQQKSK